MRLQDKFRDGLIGAVVALVLVAGASADTGKPDTTAMTVAVRLYGGVDSAAMRHSLGLVLDAAGEAAALAGIAAAALARQF